MTQVYKPSSKGLRKSGEQEPNDRYLFTSNKSAIIYDCTNNHLIEAFGHKSIDCYVQPVNELKPESLTVTVNTARQLNTDQKNKMKDLALLVGISFVYV